MNNIFKLSGPLLAMCLLAACSGVSDTRPEVIRKSERYLEQGVEAYGNSDYVAATDFFTRALAHYRSIDDLNGILFSHINLAETALSAGAYDAVRQQLSDADRVVRTLGETGYQPRLALLWAQSYWRDGEEERALAALSSLLPRFSGEQVQQSVATLELTATMLRTSIAFASLEKDAEGAGLWLRRLESAFARSSDTSPRHLARLARFQGQWLMHRGELEQAGGLFQRALDIYRPAAARPAIAATLSESARLAIRMQQWEQAEDRLLRALFIRVWILDRVGSAEVLELLSEVYRAQDRRSAADEAAEWSRHIREDKATDWRNLGQQYLQRPLVSR